MNAAVEVLLNVAKVIATGALPGPILTIVAPILNIITPEMVGEAAAVLVQAGKWAEAQMLAGAYWVLQQHTASLEPSTVHDLTDPISGVRGEQMATSEPSTKTVGDVLGPIGQDAGKAPAYPGGVQPGPGEGNTSPGDMAAIHGGP